MDALPNGNVMEKAGRNFNLRTRPPKDHFEKVLEAVCPHHPYPIKHKLRDCTMMKRFMSPGLPTDSDKLASDLRGKGTALGEAKVMTIID
jgi:hypothetical protein